MNRHSVPENDLRMAQRDRSKSTGTDLLNRMSLAHRLILPLTILAMLFCGAVVFLLVNRVSGQMDKAVNLRLERLANALIESGVVLDSTLLSRVKAVTGLEVVAFSPEGTILASTLPDDMAGHLLQYGDTGRADQYIHLDDERHLVIVQRTGVGSEGSFILAVAATTRPMEELKTEVAWTIVITSGIGLLLAMLLVHMIVKSATRPLSRLAHAARNVGQGALDRPVPEGGSREAVILAREFNLMMTELSRSRGELVENVRLATAGKMAAGVAHEIRNPLSCIRLKAQLLMEQRSLDRRTRMELGEILAEVDRLDMVLDNFLNVALPSRFRPTPVDCNAEIDSTLQLLKDKLDHQNIRVRKEYSDDLPKISLDNHLIRQALINIILNAMEEMAGGGQLRVSTGRIDGVVEMAIEDSGGGVSPELAERVFDPFFTTKPAGAGLGLHLVRNIVELHGGAVRLESSGHGGTRCVLNLPLKDVDSAPSEETEDNRRS